MSDATSGNTTEGGWFSRRVVPYLPYPHFMALAPIETVLRMLIRARFAVPWQYWPRLAFLLLASTVASVITLPERLAIAAWMRWRPRPAAAPAPVFVLGYFRSGTTFLETLLSLDPNLRAPRWIEALAPHAFVVSWSIARVVLVPFMPLVRIQDVMPLAPTLPAEDDFALSNWGLVSIMSGRLVLPSEQPFYDRYNDLDRLAPAERAAWEGYQRAFVDKLMLVAGSRRLVLKSPSHTARVRHLLRLFPGAKFVHISRPPEQVFQSNLTLIAATQGAFRLQHPLPDAEQDEIIVNEYLASERHYLADRALIPAGDLAEVRLQDLAADPIGELRRIHGEIGLPFPAEYERRLAALAAAPRKRKPLDHAPLNQRQTELVARLAPLRAAFGHDRPAKTATAGVGKDRGQQA